MPKRTLLRLTGDTTPTPTQRLARAIADIDKRLESFRLNNQPAPLSAYRARHILRAALARCSERSAILPPAR